MKIETNNQAKNWLQAALCGESTGCNELTEDTWQLIWQQATESGVIPLLHYQLSETGSFSNCPAFIQEQLADYAFQAVATEMLRQHDLNATLKLFGDNGLKYLLMKGTPLAYSLYPQAYLRVRCDTDILFKNKDDAESAWKLLKDLGYTRRNTTTGEFVGYQFSCTRKISHGFHQALDIHNRLNDYEFFAATFEFDELYQQSIQAPDVSETARAFSRVHAMLHACMHRVAHIPHGEENRLIWLYDIHLLSKAFSKQEWQELNQLAKKKGIAGVCLDGLKITQKTFHTELDAAILDELAAVAKNEKFSPHEKGKRWELYYLAFKATPGIKNKLKQLRNHFLPSVEYMMNKYQPKSKLQLPYLYVYRVVKGVGRYF